MVNLPTEEQIIEVVDKASGGYNPMRNAVAKAILAAYGPALECWSTNLRQQIADLQRTVVETNERYHAVKDAAECWSIVEQLRAPEGAEVILLCDNPDFNGQPNNAVEIVDDWTRWNIQRFTGGTMLEALRTALKARDTKTEGAQHRSNPNLKPGLEKAAEIVGNMRQSEAGLIDAAHSGQRGEDRSTALYDAYQAIKKAII
jgi:hypothetical protein